MRVRIELLTEATAIVNLHAQAVAVQNIQSLIPVVLDVSDNYARWRDRFLLAVSKFSLRDHVLSDAPLLRHEVLDPGVHLR